MRPILFFVTAALMIAASTASAQPTPVPKDELPRAMLHLEVRVSEGTPTLYITGNQPALGNWNPAVVAFEGEGTKRTFTGEFAQGDQIEFKMTLGNWDEEALAPDGTIPGNTVVFLDHDTTMSLGILAFGKKRDAPPPAASADAGVVGTIRYHESVPSKHLDHSRHIAVWLPPGYDESEARYPVLYMHDGGNLFDPRQSFTGVDWGVDETLTRLINLKRVPPMIVVGIYNSRERTLEYSPWDRGADYESFILGELMPMIDAEYRTLTGPENTGMMGSSMGALITLWIGWRHPEVFGRLGCVSTHYVAGTGRIVTEIEEAGGLGDAQRVYFDYGTEGIDALYRQFQDRMTAVLEAEGWTQGDQFMVFEATGADHNELAWRTRLEKPMMFLFGERPDQPTEHVDDEDAADEVDTVNE